jgi:hypothetical protein
MTTYGMELDAEDRRIERRLQAARATAECLAFAIVLTLAFALGMAAVLIGEAWGAGL